LLTAPARKIVQGPYLREQPGQRPARHRVVADYCARETAGHAMSDGAKRQRVERNAEQIEAFLKRTAMTVLEAPKEKREAVYEIVESEVSRTFDPDFAKNFMTWLRDLVSLIEKSGGGQGGTA
jgi:hypothetical protein